MDNIGALKVHFKWIAVVDKDRYPLKGVYHVFVQNIFELLFLVGFVWYFNWPPLFVLFCCIAEACALYIFSAVKITTSMGLLYKSKNKLVWILGFACLVLCIFQGVVYFTINSQENLFVSLKLLWNDNEFLFCVVAVIIQPYLEYLKYKKALQFFPADIEDTFVNPVLKLLVQQLILLIAMVLLLFFSGMPLLIQALILSFVWSMVKTLLGQIQIAFLPISK